MLLFPKNLTINENQVSAMMIKLIKTAHNLFVFLLKIETIADKSSTV